MYYVYIPSDKTNKPQMKMPKRLTVSFCLNNNRNVTAADVSGYLRQPHTHKTYIHTYTYTHTHDTYTYTQKQREDYLIITSLAIVIKGRAIILDRVIRVIRVIRAIR